MTETTTELVNAREAYADGQAEAEAAHLALAEVESLIRQGQPLGQGRSLAKAQSRAKVADLRLSGLAADVEQAEADAARAEVAAQVEAIRADLSSMDDQGPELAAQVAAALKAYAENQRSKRTAVSTATRDLLRVVEKHGSDALPHGVHPSRAFGAYALILDGVRYEPPKVADATERVIVDAIAGAGFKRPTLSLA